LLVLVYLRKGETFAEISAGFAVSATTAWRYVEETVMLLSARSPKLAQAVRKAVRDGLTHVILDGTLIHTDRVKADRPYFSGKHRVHGMNVQVIAGPDGTARNGHDGAAYGLCWADRWISAVSKPDYARAITVGATPRTRLSSPAGIGPKLATQVSTR
jgi:hypothetical protein